MNTYKVALIGDGGVGKSSFVVQHLHSRFESRYFSTICVEVHSLSFQTNRGRFELNVWDCAGQEKLGGLRDGYYLGSDIALIFCDYTNKKSYKNLRHWTTNFKRMCPGKPIIYVANKNEGEQKFSDPLLVPISTKTGYNINEPILQVLRTLTGDTGIELSFDRVNAVL